MKTFFKSNIAKIAALLLLGVLSFCWAAPFMTQPEIYQRSIDSLQAKQETVLELNSGFYRRFRGHHPAARRHGHADCR